MKKYLHLIIASLLITSVAFATSVRDLNEDFSVPKTSNELSESDGLGVQKRNVICHSSDVPKYRSVNIFLGKMEGTGIDFDRKDIITGESRVYAIDGANIIECGLELMKLSSVKSTQGQIGEIEFTIDGDQVNPSLFLDAELMSDGYGRSRGYQRKAKEFLSFASQFEFQTSNLKSGIYYKIKLNIKKSKNHSQIVQKNVIAGIPQQGSSYLNVDNSTGELRTVSNAYFAQIFPSWISSLETPCDLQPEVILENAFQRGLTVDEVFAQFYNPREPNSACILLKK